MMQASRELGFALEAAARLLVVDELGVQHLDGERARHLRVARAKHVAHRAATEMFLKPVPARQDLADQEPGIRLLVGSTTHDPQLVSPAHGHAIVEW
jgi:hypothetical protein